MKKMTYILVDDEPGNRSVLSTYLSKYCPDIEKVGEAESADTTFELINKVKPDLVFLDVKMPRKSGFELLRMFDKITFDVIFITAFDEYAIQAFEFNAIDYVLKPIDYQRLISAVTKAKTRYEQKKPQWENILHIVHSIDEKEKLVKKLLLHQQGIVRMVNVEDISYIRAQRGYCEISTQDNQKFVSTKTLKDHEELLSSLPFFISISKSVIINTAHIQSYSKGSLCIITLKDKSEFQVSRRKKAEIMERLK